MTLALTVCLQILIVWTLTIKMNLRNLTTKTNEISIELAFSSGLGLLLPRCLETMSLSNERSCKRIST